MSYKFAFLVKNRKYAFVVLLNVAFLIIIYTYCDISKCENNLPVVSKQEFVNEENRKDTDLYDQQRRLKLFDRGPLFEVSFSPLYKNVLPVKNFSTWTFQSSQRVTNVDCSQLFEQNPKEIEKVHKMNVSESASVCLKSKDCENFITRGGYIMHPLSDEEADFSIAFSILVYKSPEQFEILLRAIYRPQNVYCVHVDNKTTGNDFNEFQCIIRCFPNVFLATDRKDVKWGKIGVLTAELSCMKDLLSFKKWKYFINLTGQEFPLRTNYELVQILKIYNGSNDGEGTVKRFD